MGAFRPSCGCSGELQRRRRSREERTASVSESHQRWLGRCAAGRQGAHVGQSRLIGPFTYSPQDPCDRPNERQVHHQPTERRSTPQHGGRVVRWERPRLVPPHARCACSPTRVHHPSLRRPRFHLDRSDKEKKPNQSEEVSWHCHVGLFRPSNALRSVASDQTNASAASTH